MPYTLTVSRELFVPRDLVFQVWTERDHVSAWYSPGSEFVRTVSIDLRPGGTYQFTWTAPDGAHWVQRGEYRSIEAPAGFRCSQCFEAGFGDGYCTELSVALADARGSTGILIRQEGFPSAATRDAQRQLWSDLLDQLEAYFSVI